MLKRFVVFSAMLMLVGCGGYAKPTDIVSGLAEGGRSEEVVLINTFKVSAGRTIAAVAMWEAARDFMREQDGFISARLHISVDNRARYRMVNIARWESAEQFRAAVSALRESGIVKPVEGVEGDPHLYTPLRGGKRGWF